MGEFDRIARYLKPLAGDGAEGLEDDAARAFGRVLTKDVLVEGVHFLPTDPIGLVARKALRVNMSDLIAKGAQPTAYMLGIVWPARLGDDAFAAFAGGLAEEHAAHNLTLLGGDTTSGPVLMISITMFGVPLGDAPIRRSGGAVGDVLVVTGTIGLGLSGLEAARKNPPADDPRALAYRLPEPPFALLPFIAAHGKASLDVSDGLVADARHLATASGVALAIDVGAVPLGDPRPVNDAEVTARLTAGDDYQTLFLVDPGRLPAVEKAREGGAALSVIGRAESGEKGRVILRDGEKTLRLPRKSGWDHFDS